MLNIYFAHFLTALLWRYIDKNVIGMPIGGLYDEGFPITSFCMVHIVNCEL
jgi:hypothetical protein